MKVKLIRQDTLVCLSGLVEGVVSDVLSYTHRKQIREPFKTLDNGRVLTRESTVYERRQLYYMNSRGDIVFRQGLLRRLLNFLKKSGIPYTMEDRSTPVPEPDVGNLRDKLPDLKFRGGQDDMLAAMMTMSCGQIVAPTGLGKTFTMIAFCAMYPRSNIVITTPSAQLTRQTVERLVATFGDSEVGQLGAGKSDIRRITVVCMKSLHKYPPTKAEIVLVDEVHKAAAETVSEALSSFIYAKKMIGLTATPTGRSDNAERVIESLLGPVVLKLNYDSAVEAGAVAPMTVYMFDVKQGPKPPENKADRVVMKRRMYWKNTYRNAMIAKVVKSIFSERNPLGLNDPQVLILVDTATHVEQLSYLLPDFRLVYKSASKSSNLPNLTSGEIDAIFDGFKSGSIRKVIATSCWGTGVDFPDLDVIVLASGTSSPIETIQYTGRATRVGSGEKKKGYVVDFIDSWADYTFKRGKNREKEYRKMKWEVEKR